MMRLRKTPRTLDPRKLTSEWDRLREQALAVESERLRKVENLKLFLWRFSSGVGC